MYLPKTKEVFAHGNQFQSVAIEDSFVLSSLIELEHLILSSAALRGGL